MRAKSDQLALRRRGVKPRPRRARRNGPTRRLAHAERRRLILEKAAEFFAEYGLTAQTRALAEACGVSQRLLYRFFPNKAALLEEVYRTAIAGPFKAVWFAKLQDRRRKVEERLTDFYLEYYEGVLTTRWLRLFLYASLAETAMAPVYIGAVVTRFLEIIVEEAAREQRITLPRNRALRHELAWTLHGAVSHLAIRREVYRDRTPVAPERVIAIHVRSFLAGLPAAVAAAGARDARALSRRLMT
jgi:AcrR family transcriptional regulator